MTRSTSALANDFSFALNAYKLTGSVKELWYLKRFAALLISGQY